jgi:hypothetical protein
MRLSNLKAVRAPIDPLISWLGWKKNQGFGGIRHPQ